MNLKSSFAKLFDSHAEIFSWISLTLNGAGVDSTEPTLTKLWRDAKVVGSRLELIQFELFKISWSFWKTRIPELSQSSASRSDTLVRPRCSMICRSRIKGLDRTYLWWIHWWFILIFTGRQLKAHHSVSRFLL